MKAEIFKALGIVSIIALVLSIPFMPFAQEPLEIGRIEVVTRDFEVGDIGEIVVNEITEKKTSWSILELDGYIDYHKANLVKSQRIIDYFTRLRGKILESVKEVKLKKGGEKTL